MKIIILGAGQVGSSVAENLASEKNDVTIVDIDQKKLTELADRLDVRIVQGMASHPSILRKAGAEDADMLIAVTSSDEINMIACQIAYSLYRTPTKISRVRSTAYHNKPELFCKENIPIDVLISPEKLVTKNIRDLIDHPGALQVVEFADGLVKLVGVKAFYGGPLVGQEIQKIREHMPGIDTRVAAIYRKGGAITPTAETIIEVDDEVFFIAATEHIMPVMAEMRKVDRPYKKVLIAGGGNIGARLAQDIESSYQVKIIERSDERAKELSQMLDRTLVICGNASDKELLLEENIDSIDVFCALTNDDEANIMSSLLAKRLGARKVIALITNPAYVDLVQGGEIDIAISPQQITIGSLLRHIRRGDTTNVHSLRRGAAEAIEVVAHGTEKNSRVIGKALGDLVLPSSAGIGAIVRNNKVLIAHRHIIIEPDDHVILFLTNKSSVYEIEKLFSPDATWV